MIHPGIVNAQTVDMVLLDPMFFVEGRRTAYVM